MLLTVRTIAAALAALLLAGMILAAPAIAQAAPPALPSIASFDDLTEEQQDEIYCVYDAVGNDKDAQALQDWFIYGEKDKKTTADAVFDRAAAACKAKYKWSDDQIGVAHVLANGGVLADLLEEELRGEGFDDKKFEAVAGIIPKMTEADFRALLDTAYGKKPDEAALTKVRGLLYAAGVKKEGDIADLVIGFLASTLQERDAIHIWLQKKLY
jgi:hypothetical protein